MALVIMLLIFWQHDTIYEYYRGVTYVPSGEMARIRTDLELTERGEAVFNAAQPVLSSKEEFNEHCRTQGVETAILGCYTGGGIYVYNITDEELNGIRELTTAHELLHAVYAKLSDEEKSALKADLEDVYRANEGILAPELKAYNDMERFEELYVRSGTEISDLPDRLERHYAEIFRDQDKIAKYYNSYIKVFNELKTELDSLKAEIDSLNAEYDLKTAEYEDRATWLNTEISEFNTCADIVGCFATEADFYAKRMELVNAQAELDGMYAELNDLIERYNQRVKEYNSDVLKGEELNEKINSSVKPKTIEEENGRN